MALMFSFIDSKAKSRFDIKNISEAESIPLNCTVVSSADNTASYAIDRKVHTLASGTEGSVRVAKNLSTNNF